MLEIICDGDSWTFGCEIVDPILTQKHGGKNIHPGAYDFFPENVIFKENCEIPNMGNNWIRLQITDKIKDYEWIK